MRAAVYTLGCKLNQCESEALADAFHHHGFTVTGTDGEESADIYLVNTCTVTSKAEQKARRMIRKYASRPGSPVVLVTGCYAQMDPDEIDQLDPAVITIPLTRKPELLLLPSYIEDQLKLGMNLHEAVRQWAADGSWSKELTWKGGKPDQFSYQADTFSYHSRAFLKIEDGCDNKCGYCRVSIARGRAASLDKYEAADRAAALEEKGYREIVLTGVNITAYRSHDEGLEGLLKLLLGKLQKAKIRLSSLEPDMIGDELVQLIKESRIQPHFHIPVQSGSNRLLSLVRRNYTAEHVLDRIRAVRDVRDDPFLAADFIVGLPGETDEEAEETYQLAEACRFSQLHVFPYSPRPGTELATAREHVPEAVRDRRALRLRDLSHRLHMEYTRRWIGRSVEVLLERRLADGWRGLSENYLQLKVKELPAGSGSGKVLQKGDVCRAVILPADTDSIIGLTASFTGFV